MAMTPTIFPDEGAGAPPQTPMLIMFLKTKPTQSLFF